MHTINLAKKIVIYSHDTMGLGHVRRNLLIATALAKSHLKASVLLISGTHQLQEFDLPEGVDHLTLPGISKSACGIYSSKQYNLSLQHVIHLRSQIIVAAVKAFEPNIFIADNVPRGVEFELDPVLKFLSTKPEIVRILGIRDILDSPEVIREEWHKKQNENIIQNFYDVVWIYGDRNFFDTSQEYGFSKKLSTKISFTGYLNPLYRHKVIHHSNKKNEETALPENFHLCIAGGGQDGIDLTHAFALAIISSKHTGIVLTGPFLPDDALERLKKITKNHKNIQLIKFHPEPVNLIKNANKVVSMGGYNSISEILALQKTALIIPRVKPRQEQWIRACRLNDWELIDVLHPDKLNAESIKNWLDQKPKKQRTLKKLDFDGLNKIIENIDGHFQDISNNQASKNFVKSLTHINKKAKPVIS